MAKTKANGAAAGSSGSGHDGKRRPKAIANGKLFEELGLDVDCYVLNDGRRVISQRGILAALRGKTGGNDTGNLGQYIARLPSRFGHLALGTEIAFDLPAGGTAFGREGSFFVDLCDAYADAFIADELHPKQVKLAKVAISILRSLAKTGIEALIDESTGYQRSRAEHELSKRFAKYLRADVGAWENRFPASLVRALAPLYRLVFLGGSYPRALQTPFAMIYNMVFGRDFADELRSRNPNPESHCHHQLLQEPGTVILADELEVIELLAKQSRTKDEFWARGAVPNWLRVNHGVE